MYEPVFRVWLRSGDGTEIELGFANGLALCIAMVGEPKDEYDRVRANICSKMNRSAFFDWAIFDVEREAPPRRSKPSR